MKSQLVTPAATEPITLAEAKIHVRVDHAVDDTLITGLIAAARGWAESFLGRSLVTRTWRQWRDGFPEDGIELMQAPVQSVSSVKYTDPAGALQTLSDQLYIVDAKSIETPGLVVPRTSWPSTATGPNTVQIEYVAGYGDAAAVPQVFKLAMLHVIGSWYENREAVSERTMSEVPHAAERLLWPHRIVHFA